MQPGKKGIIFLAAGLVFLALLMGPALAQAKPDIVNYIQEDGLAPGTPVSVAVDAEDWAWIGNSSIDVKGVGGLSVINRNRRIMAFGQEDGLAANQVNDVAVDTGGNCLWFATSKGLSRWDGKTGEWKTYDSSNSEMKSDDVNCVHIDKDGNRWIGTHGAGLYRINVNDDKLFQVKCPLSKVTAILLDSKERLWVGSFEGIAYREGTVWVPYDKSQSTLPSNKIFSLAEHSEGKILAATNNGLAVFDGISWNVFNTKNSPLPVDNLTDMIIGKDGSVWVATWGGGVVKFDLKRQRAVSYNMKNCDIMDNQVSSLAQDSGGNIWAATKRGISYMIINPKPVIPEVVEGVNEQAYRWENKAPDPERETTVFNSLAVNRYGSVVWGYAAYFSEDLDIMNPYTDLSWGLLDNRWFSSREKTPVREFLQVCVTEGKITRHFTADKTKPYPYPASLPPEIEVYLKPGKFIPSDDKEMIELAQSMVRRSSKGDMLRTAEDIIFSKQIATMPFDYGKEETIRTGGSPCDDPRTNIIRTPQQVLQDKTGLCYSKNRLAVTLLRAMKIPARLIFENGTHVWGEAYINDWGWVPFDVTMPIYEVGKNAGSRVLFPNVVDKDEIGVTWVDGQDDDQKTMFWEPHHDALFLQGPKQAEQLKDIDKLKTAKILIFRPSSKENTRNEAKIPISNKLMADVIMAGSYYNIRFYDKSGLDVRKIPITGYNQVVEMEVPGHVKLKFIPSYMGQYLVFRMLDWQALDTDTGAEGEAGSAGSKEAGSKKPEPVEEKAEPVEEDKKAEKTP